MNASSAKLVARTLLLASLALLAARASHAQESFDVRDGGGGSNVRRRQRWLSTLQFS